MIALPRPRLLRWVPVLVLGVALYWAMSPGALPEAITLPGQEHVQVPCDSLVRAHTRVVLVLGQSNAANHGQIAGPVTAQVYSYYGGRCYQARDPLPGASGRGGGSVWTRLAPRLLQSPGVEHVLLVPLAVGGTTMAQCNSHPVLVQGLARATRCQQLRNVAVHAQQQAFPAILPNVRAGPDMDALFNARHRHDGCHFSNDGLEAAAEAWWRAINAVQPTS